MMTFSASPTPWNAPAMKGLSSTALQNITSSAAVAWATSLTTRPMRATASILMPALVEPTFTEEQTKRVWARAWGMERISFSSASVMPFCTRAE